MQASITKRICPSCAGTGEATVEVNGRSRVVAGVCRECNGTGMVCNDLRAL